MRFKSRKEFLDPRQHNFVRLGLAVPLVKLSDPDTNASRHIELAAEMWKQGVRIGVFPELGLTGYSNHNLFFQDALLEAARDALSRFRDETYQMDTLFGVGTVIPVRDNLFNCTAVVYRNSLKGFVAKSYLPNYGEYREWQFVRGADDLIDQEIQFLGETVPIGWDLLFRDHDNPDTLVHFEVCEDGWVCVPPSHLAALYGARFLLNSSASNVTGGKGDYRLMLAQATSGMCNAIRGYVSANRGESTTDCSWDGHAIFAERGTIVREGTRFNREPFVITHDADLTPCIADRRRQGTHNDNRRSLEKRFGNALHFREIEFGTECSTTDVVKTAGCVLWKREAPFVRIRRDISPTPFIPNDPQVLLRLCEEEHNIQAHALADRWEGLPPKTKAVINWSGGKDSLNALACSVHASRLLKKPPTEIICLTLPGYGTTPGTLEASREIANAFGVDFREIPIVGTNFNLPLAMRSVRELGLADHLLYLIGHDGLEQDLAYENAQAWCRTMVALAIGARQKGFMVGTGTLSELAVGWCTMFGDHASHFGINSGLAKTLEVEILRWMADHVYCREARIRRVMHWVCDEMASPELKRASSTGQILQSTDEAIGPLIPRDFFLHWGVRFGMHPTKIHRMAMQAYEETYLPEDLLKYQSIFWKRFFAAQYKRNCMPDGPKVGLVCLSPRGDWMMPSDASSTVWFRALDDLQKIPWRD